jgi:hypothetical protein
MVFIGSHPGKCNKAVVNENRFRNTNERLMTGSKYPRTIGD